MEAHAPFHLPEIKVTSAEHTRQLEKRFTYLWTSAHALLPTNSTLAHHMMYAPPLLRSNYVTNRYYDLGFSASMMQLARSSHAQLPQSVLDFICEKCGGLVVPSVSADVRVLPQSRKSPLNRRLVKQQRCAQHQNGLNGPRLVRETLSTILVRFACGYLIECVCG